MKLIPVIAQDARTNEVLMLAWTDKEALRRTRKSKFMHYWSRSREKYWKKGETSGHVQKVKSLHYDCDRDTILARVEQTGPACHEGTETCFGGGRGSFLPRLEETIRDRKKNPKKGSYTNRLLDDPALLRDKVREEANELLMASRGKKKGDIIGEAGDLIYHAMVLLASRGVSLEEVEKELRKRHGG
jgi:phosphoribosyl-ATP pyrophosphohydrolase/phosphoribosyl-AMP cyclohydrolase